MIYELLYTSAPAGLRPGSSGYCTVQSSRGIPAPTVDLLESLSGYRHVYTAGTPEAVHNPVNFGHYLLRIHGRSQHVLSRVSDCPLDHTGRSNKIGHHMVIDAPDAIPAGPAWLMRQPGWMTERWDGQVTTLNSIRKAPGTARPAGICTAWKRVTGDAGWAGVLAESFQKDTDRKVFLIYKPGTDLLALFEEALALLPPARRWEVTFSTYGAALPATVECAWSGVISGSQEEHLSKRFVNALRIDLTAPAGPAPEAGPLVEIARTGKTATHAPTAAPIKAHAVTPPPAPHATPKTASSSDIVSSGFAHPADPDAPPPVRRPVQQKTGNGSLILIVIFCCLLFGGGTMAGLVYLMQQNQEVLLADVGETKDKTEGEQNSEEPKSSVDETQYGSPVAPKPSGLKEEHGEIKNQQIEEETLHDDHENPEGAKKPDQWQPETNQNETASVSIKNKGSDNTELAGKEQFDHSKTNPPKTLPPIVIYPKESIVLVKDEQTDLSLPDGWSHELGIIKRAVLLLPRVVRPDIADDFPVSPISFTVESTPVVRRSVKKKTQLGDEWKEYDCHDFHISSSGFRIATCTVCCLDGLAQRIVIHTTQDSGDRMLFNSALLIEGENSQARIFPLRRQFVSGPVGHQRVSERGDSEKDNRHQQIFRVQIPHNSSLASEFRDLTPLSLLDTSDSVTLRVGSKHFTYQRNTKMYFECVEDFRPAKLTGKLTFDPNANSASSETRSTFGLFSFIPDGINQEVKGLRKSSEDMISDANKKWTKIRAKVLSLTNENKKMIESEDEQFLDPSKSQEMINKATQVEIACGRLENLFQNLDRKKGKNSGDSSEREVVDAQFVSSFVQERKEIQATIEMIRLKEESRDNSTVSDFHIEISYEWESEDSERVNFSVPILTVTSGPLQ